LCRYPTTKWRVKRKHRHLLKVARALRFQASSLIDFWGGCILTAAYLINRTPSSILGGKTPFEALFKAKPSYEHIKVFECLCYVHNYQRSKDKFSTRGWKCIFIGYPYGKKGWKVYDVETGDVFISRDVIFRKIYFLWLRERKQTHPEKSSLIIHLFFGMMILRISELGQIWIHQTTHSKILTVSRSPVGAQPSKPIKAAGPARNRCSTWRGA